MVDVMELHTIITPQGEQLDLNQLPLKAVLNTPSNMGLPPLDIITSRGYRQDGVTRRDVFLQPRTIGIEFRLSGNTEFPLNRDLYHQYRAEFLDFLRPNLGSEQTYIFTRSDGSRRAIHATPITPVFPSSGGEWDEFSFQEVIQLIAHDPTFYDPDTATVIRSATDSELVFPITFFGGDIIFGGDFNFGQFVVTYLGTWYSYPSFRITGPFSSFILNHLEAGVAIQYLGSKGAGEYVDIVLGQEFQCVDDQGIDVTGYLSPDTNLIAFRLDPSPIRTNGTNTIEITLNNFDTSQGSDCTMDYLTRYVGI